MEGFVHKLDNWFLQFDLHGAIPLPLPPIALHIAGDRLFLELGSKNNHWKILADNFPALSREFTVDGWILHYNLTPPWPPNWLLAVIIPFSQNKLEFAAARVRGPDGPLAMALARTQGPSMACNDPCMMLSSQVHTGGTVLVGFTLADVIAGLEMCVQDAIIDALANALGWATGGYLKGPIKEAYGAFLEKEGREVLEDFMSTGLVDAYQDSMEALYPGSDTFTAKSMQIESAMGDIPGDAQARAAAMLFGGPFTRQGADIFFSQSEALAGD